MFVMESNVNSNHIVLGNTPTKMGIFKCLDALINNESSNKDSTERSLMKYKESDPFETLKCNYKIKVDKMHLSNNDCDVKSSKVTRKRKLHLLKQKSMSGNNDSLQYLCLFLDPKLDKSSKTDRDFSRWYSKKLIANCVSKCRLIREFSIESQAVSLASTMYKSKSIFTVRPNGIVFQIYMNDWCTMEFPLRFIRTCTLYSKLSFVKLEVKGTLFEELSTMKTSSEHALTLHHKESTKKAIYIFSDTKLTKIHHSSLMSVVGADKVQWNESETESKSLIENILSKNKSLSEILSNSSRPNWSMLFKPPRTPIPQPQVPISTAKIPLPKPNTTDNIFALFQLDATKSSPIVNGSFPQTVVTHNTMHPPYYPNNGVRLSQQPIHFPAMLTNVITLPQQPYLQLTQPQQPIQPQTQFSYIKDRDITNVFETFHYNPSPKSDVLIHGSDLLCLNEKEYLNDNIINFYLNYIRYEIMDEDQRERTHLFNVFFNTKLCGSGATSTTDTPEMRHARVAKWTKKVDIFDKDFIIIPINENQHWFLALVCFPWMAGMISYDRLFGTNANQAVLDIPVNNTPFATKYRTDRANRLRQEKGVDPSPCILLFDSLQSVSRAPNVKLIREYLKSEWDSKRSVVDGPLVFDKNTVRGFNPQVPQQTNGVDCGIYILHYVENFFHSPLKVFTKEYFQSSLVEWFPSNTVSDKRKAIQNMLLKMADTYEAAHSNNNNNNNNSDTLSHINNNTNNDSAEPDLLIL